MAVAAVVVAVRDHNDDHEVGGQDLPATVILRTDTEDTAAVADMVREGLGSFGRITAFGVRVEAAGCVRFKTFDAVDIGEQFTWCGSVNVERIAHHAKAKIHNVIERGARLALLALQPSSAGEQHLADRTGAPIKVGSWCRFYLASSFRSGIAWVDNISDHPQRPIGIRWIGDTGNYSLGAMPSELEIRSDLPC
jgi:hypothetical protein